MNFNLPSDNCQECKDSIGKVGKIFFLCIKLMNGILLALWAATIGQHALIGYIGAFGWIAYFFSELMNYSEKEEKQKFIDGMENKLKKLQEELNSLKK